MELVLLQSAAGQNLGGFGGKLDFIARRCRVGVYKLCAVNDGFAVQRINEGACHKLTFAVISDGESDLVFTGIIPDAAEVVIHLADDIGLLAYGRREIQGKRNFAVCLVRGGFNNLAVFTQIEREVVLVQCAVADHDIQFLGGVQGYRNVVGVIGVYKRGRLRFFGAAIFRNGVICHLQLAAAVVRDGNRHTVGGVVIRNTGDFTFGGDILGDFVLISAGFGEGDTSEVKGNLRSVAGEANSIPHICLYICISHISQRGTIDSLQFEAEFIAVLPIAARQNLYALERVIGVIRAHDNRGGVIGVCHRDFLGCTCFDLARVVRIARGVACGQTIARFRDGIGAACGQAYDFGGLAVFQLEGTVALDGIVRHLSTLSIGNGVVVRGTGVQAIARQRKLHRKIGVAVRGQTRVGCNHLGNFQAACGVHGQLTVVAKVQHTLVCDKVPLEVNAAVGSAGSVAASNTICLFLIAQLVINGGGQAAFFDALLDVALAIFCFNALFDFVLSCNANGHIVGLGNRLSTITGIKLQVVQLIVIGLSRLYHCGRRISAFTGVQQGILGVIVEAVACCRGKGGSGQADGSFCAVCRCCCFAAVKFVGVEVDFAVFGVLRNIGGKGGVGNAAGRNLLARIFIKADRVDDADGLGVVDYQLGGAIGACGLIIPQGQHTGRDLDPHVVAVTAVAMGDGDNDILQIGGIGVGVADRAAVTRKGIGIHSWGLVYGFVPKDLFGKGNGLKVFDFHVIAQGIIESHIAFFLGVVRNLRGACRCGRYRREDVLKDILQPISAGSRHIVICLVRSVAEVPFPLQGAFRSRVSGRGVVAGDRLHEFVFI